MLAKGDPPKHHVAVVYRHTVVRVNGIANRVLFVSAIRLVVIFGADLWSDGEQFVRISARLRDIAEIEVEFSYLRERFAFGDVVFGFRDLLVRP